MDLLILMDLVELDNIWPIALDISNGNIWIFILQ